MVVQTSVVVIQREAKKRLMACINKLMWLACVMVSVSFLALSYIVVGDHHKRLAIGVTFVGTFVMATTLGIMCYWVIVNRIEASKIRRIRNRRSALSSSGSMFSMMSDPDILNNEYKTVYAI